MDQKSIYSNIQKLIYFSVLTGSSKIDNQTHHQSLPSILLASTTRGQTAEARKTTILQPVEKNPHLQKDRQDEKTEGYIPDEGTRKNPRKTTK